MVRITAGRLPTRYRRALARYTYGPGAAKADFLVTERVPWANRAVGQATTVHLGGTRADVFRSQTTTAAGVLADEPFVLVVDPVAADPERARPGKNPLWAYAHVPKGVTSDPVELITACIERYAPGFRDTVIAQRGISTAQYEEYNPNYVGGDIGTGAMTISQSLLRPAPRTNPYRLPIPGVYLCSAATPPARECTACPAITPPSQRSSTSSASAKARHSVPHEISAAPKPVSKRADRSTPLRTARSGARNRHGEGCCLRHPRPHDDVGRPPLAGVKRTTPKRALAQKLRPTGPNSPSPSPGGARAPSVPFRAVNRGHQRRKQSLSAGSMKRRIRWSGDI